MMASASARGLEKAIIGKMTPFTFAELTSMGGKSDHFNVPIIKPIIIVMTTAVAPASVGVNQPENMP